MKIDNTTRESRFQSRSTTTANHEALNTAYSNTRNETPAATVAALVDSIGYTAAVETVAELVNSVGAWDGRISTHSRAWAESIDTAATNEDMRGFYSIYSSIHPAHIDQLAEAMEAYTPEEPAAEEPAEAAEDAAEEEKTEAIRTLLTVNNHGLQDLHTVLGLDFCAPFDAWTINGKFTVNQITNEASKRGYNCRNSVIAVCTRDKSSTRYVWSCDFNLATVDGGKVKIEYETPYHDSGRGLDTFTAKKYFEELRKSNYAETVVFVQCKSNLKRPRERKLDVFGRYKLLKFGQCYNASVNKTYINRLYLQEIGASGKQLKHDIGRVIFAGQPHEVIDQVIDKSGYLLYARRDELKRRAAALRKEREKAAFVASDNGAKIEELQALIVARKAEIVKALEAATTAAELKSVYASLSTWDGFAAAVSDFERLKERDASKAYSSIAQFTEAYTAIYNTLTRKDYE